VFTKASWFLYMLLSPLAFLSGCTIALSACVGLQGGYKDDLQPETLADGNWLVKQNQPVSKIETKSDTNLRSPYEFYV
jgi:hypothetical protein